MDVNSVIKENLTNLKTTLDSFVSEKVSNKNPPDIKNFLGIYFEVVNKLYQDMVPVNPGWADSMPIVAFIKHQKANTE